MKFGIPIIATYLAIVSAVDNRSEANIWHDKVVGAFHGKSVSRCQLLRLKSAYFRLV